MTFFVPRPPLPNLEVSNTIVEKVTDHTLVWINRLLAVGHGIAIKRDRKVFYKGLSLYEILSFSNSIVYLFLIMCALPYPYSP
jgi:hypothetical protein